MAYNYNTESSRKLQREKQVKDKTEIQMIDKYTDCSSLLLNEKINIKYLVQCLAFYVLNKVSMNL